MDGKKKIAMLIDAIEQANSHNQFNQNNIHLSVEVNAFGNKVDIYNNGKVIMSAKEANLSMAAEQILKWLTISGIPPFINLHIFIEDGEVKIIPE